MEDKELNNAVRDTVIKLCETVRWMADSNHDQLAITVKATADFIQNYKGEYDVPPIGWTRCLDDQANRLKEYINNTIAKTLDVT